MSIRGSATAVRYSDSEYVALLHTKEKNVSKGGYTTRAYKFEARPPFRVTQISKPLKLQSSHLAFASSINVVAGKVMVGYGVHDREPRVLVMSRKYFEAQFLEDCDGAIDRYIAESGETCAEKVVSYMRGEKLMPPRRAMDVVAREHFECQALVSKDCTLKSIIKTAARTKQAATCTEAFSKMAAGATCSGRAKWLIQKMDKVDAHKALRIVAEEWPECKEVASLKCTSQDLHYPEETCKPNAFNNYKVAAPAVLLSVHGSGSNFFGPLVHCSGISVETEKCEGDLDLAFVDSKDEVMGQCLADGQYHLVNAQTRVNSKAAHNNAVPMVGAVAAELGGRSIDDASPSKVILVTSNPLSVVFSWAESVLGGLGAANDVEGHDDISVARRNLEARSSNRHGSV